MNYARQYPRFWLCYFVLSAVLLVGNGALALATALEPGAPARLLGVLFGVVGLLPLYGFVRQRRFNPRWLWQALFIVSSMATVLAVAICLFTAFASVSAMPIVLGAVLVVLSAPYLFALQQYTLRSPHLWQ